MPDILRTMTDESAVDKDPAGLLVGLKDWSEKIAEQTAGSFNIRLTPAHWEVIHFLRDYYRENGQPLHARAVLLALEKRFKSQGGRKYLYTLFPGGAVTQASKIAGLQPPKDSVDPSFGSSM